MKKYQQCVTLLIIVLYLLLQVGCDASQGLIEEDKVNINAMGNETIITEFYYSVSDYSSGHAYGIGIDPDGNVIVNYLHYGFFVADGINDVSFPLTQEKHKELVQIIEIYDLASWDGWGQEKEEKSPYIIIEDGGGFKLEIQWSDGTSILAEQDVPLPKNFFEVDAAIKEFFEFYLKDWKKANNIE